MRAITAVAIAFAVLVGIALASYSYIDSTAHQLVGELDRIEGAINQGQWGLATDQLATTHNRWERTKQVWTVLLNHREIDNIDIAINRLEKYIATQGSTFSLGELASLRLLFKHVADTESLTLENIL